MIFCNSARGVVRAKVTASLLDERRCGNEERPKGSFLEGSDRIRHSYLAHHPLASSYDFFIFSQNLQGTGAMLWRASLAWAFVAGSSIPPRGPLPPRVMGGFKNPIFIFPNSIHTANQFALFDLMATLF